MNIIFTILGILGLVLLGFFFGLWSSFKAHEKETEERIQSGLFQFEGKSYEIKNISKISFAESLLPNDKEK